MDIAKYIIQILKEHDQVIVPGLGSFVAEYKSAKIHPVDHNFTPPVKQIVFDNYTPEDDLLIKRVAEAENVSIEKAIVEVRNFTDQLINEIQQYRITNIKMLGTFTLKPDNTIVFTAEKGDISDESYGLEEFTSQAAVKNEYKEKAIQQMQKAKQYEVEVNNRNKKYIFIGVSVAFLVVLVSLIFFTDIFKNLLYDTDVKMDRPHQEMAIQDNVVEEAVIADTLTEQDNSVQTEEQPTTEAKTPIVEKEKPKEEAKPKEKPKEQTKPKPIVEKEKPKETVKFYLVAGSFKVQENAEKRVAELKTKGYKTAGFLQANNKGLFTVYYNSYKTKDDAEEQHQKIMKEENPESWVLKK
jgi:cell division protein FtsN/nucleoid DNA-binding protein